MNLKLNILLKNLEDANIDTSKIKIVDYDESISKEFEISNQNFKEQYKSHSSLLTEICEHLKFKFPRIEEVFCSDLLENEVTILHYENGCLYRKTFNIDKDLNKLYQDIENHFKQVNEFWK